MAHLQWKPKPKPKFKDDEKFSLYKCLHSRSMPTINSKISTSHETASARKQKHSRRFEVFRRSKTSEQCTRHPGLFDFWFGG